MATLAERLKKYRYEQIINQQELADRCGVSKQTIYSIENGLQEPSLLTLAKIEAVIGKENNE
jgi:DNA-binding XRE family transcriptional regulator